MYFKLIYFLYVDMKLMSHYFIDQQFGEETIRNQYGKYDNKKSR